MKRVCCILFLSAVLVGGINFAEIQAGEHSTSPLQTGELERNLHKELRRIHREIAALRAELESPGVPEILGGIGYIFGIFGTACYIAGKKNRR